MAARTKTQQAGRTAVKGGTRAAAAPRASGTSGGGSAPTTARRAPEGGPRGRAKAPGPSRKRELVALVLLGVAVFLFVVLLAGGTGGVLGRGSATGLIYAFGRLALVVPLLLLVGAATCVLDVSVRRSGWFAGGLVFLFGLFLLVAAGAPPVGGHGIGHFVRPAFEGRSGGLGEALYVLFHGLAGAIGVGIIGWVTVVAGLSLATGMTAAHVIKGTKRAAGAVRDSAGRRMTLARNRGDEEPELGDFDFFPEGGVAPWGGRTAPATARAPQLGPVDLVGESSPSEWKTEVSPSNPFGQEFEEWSDGRTAERSPLAPARGGAAGGSVLDGARAFDDIYTDTPEVSAAAGCGGRATGTVVSGAAATAAAPAAMGLAAGAGTASAAGAAVVDTGLEWEAGGYEALHTDVSTEMDGGDFAEESSSEGQAVIPGLGRAPKQTVLPVEQPAYLLPDSELLRKSTPTAAGNANQRDTASVVVQALAQFGVEARVIDMVVGPRVTRYELQLAPGTKVAKVSALKDDLAYALATTEIRILAPIPGKSAVGVEVPNQRPDFVTLGDIYREFPKGAGPLHVWLGKDISGKPVFADLSKLPHLLIAGTTGSGKSGCVNCIVSSILLRSTPEQVRLIMIDPKKVELSHYDRIPHLLVPVVTNMKDAAGVLHNVAKEMEDRYELMELERCRSLGDMNKARARRGERPMPYILIVIDELADLMMVSPQEVEEYVIRLAQKSRAVGIHLVVATQRPSADVITGMIKANIPSRIAFAVSSQTDSRVILDVNGAETLLGLGDMLFKPLGSSHLERVQGAFITEEEIALLVNHWRHQGEPHFREELMRRPPDAKELKRAESDDFDPDSDDLLAEAAQLVIETGSASVSMLQRRLRVGYTRAGRLIDMLERRGIVGPWEGSKPRQILIEADEVEHVMAGLRLEGGVGSAGDEIDGD